MAKPQMLFGQQAPQSISMMGQGVADSGARMAQMYAQGLESIGKNVGNAILQTAGIYENEQQTNQAADAVKKFISVMPDKETEGSMGFMLNQYVKDPNVSNAQIAKFGTGAISEYMKSVFDMQRIREQNKGRLDVAGMRAAGGGGQANENPTTPPSFSR
jgi:hypothetical protein